MRRYSCSIGGTFVIVDVLAVKASREPLVLSGGAYNGPGFDEGETAHSELHLEEYFHVNTDAVMSGNGNLISAGASQASLGGSEHPFTPDSARTCAHVDATVKDGGASVLLEPRCGMSKGRAPDGSGSISGFAVGGGGFVYDGLVTSEDRYLTPHYYKLRRFRFVAPNAVGVKGDVRAFALASSVPHNRTNVPSVRLSSCAAAIGCPAGDAEPLKCACVEICTAGQLRWAAVTDGHLTGVLVVGTCGSALNTLNATLVDRAKVVTRGRGSSECADTLATAVNAAGCTCGTQLCAGNQTCRASTSTCAAPDPACAPGCPEDARAGKRFHGHREL